MSDQELIWASLEIAAERCDDLVPPIYRRLFEARPQVEEIFAVGPGDRPNPAMGSMVNEILALVAEGIDNGALNSTIMSTLITHLGWGVDLDLYDAMLSAVVDSVRAECAEQWTDAMHAAWQRRMHLIMDSLRDNQSTIDQQQHH